MVTLDNWQSRMDEDMKLRDFTESTRRAYLLAVRQCIRWVDGDLSSWCENDIRRYVLYLRDEKQAAPSTINIAVHALKFFLTRTMQKEWPLIELLYVKRRKKILSC